MPSVMIDPGHGPGNVNMGPSGYREYEGMWKLSNFLKSALERSGISAYLTREEWEDPSLPERGRAAAGHDVFLSQHSNAAGEALAGQLRGTEVYYSVRQPENYAFAADMSFLVARTLGIPNNGAKTWASASNPTRDYFGVMRAAVDAGCPHVLFSEIAYHDNVEDEALLLDDENLRRAAEAQAEVICRFLGVEYVWPE